MFRCLLPRVKYLGRYRRFLRVFVISCALILFGLYLVLSKVFSSDNTEGWMTYRGHYAADYVRPEKFTALTVVKNVCTLTRIPSVLIIVCSGVGNDQHRLVIRETWAAETKKFNVNVFFLVGKSTDQQLNDDVISESITYGDVIIEDFLDTYYNLTLKSIMLLKWVKQNCPLARFVMKTDDDVYMNVENLLNLINDEHIKPKDVFIGKMYSKERPDRRISSKWYVPENVYPNYMYPQFLCGVGFLMSGDVALRLYEESFKHELFFLEDVFLTGICADRIQVKRRDHLGFHFFEHPVDVECNAIHPHMILLSHYVSPRKMRRMHYQLAKCNM